MLVICAIYSCYTSLWSFILYVWYLALSLISDVVPNCYKFTVKVGKCISDWKIIETILWNSIFKSHISTSNQKDIVFTRIVNWKYLWRLACTEMYFINAMISKCCQLCHSIFESTYFRCNSISCVCSWVRSCVQMSIFVQHSFSILLLNLLFAIYILQLWSEFMYFLWKYRNIVLVLTCKPAFRSCHEWSWIQTVATIHLIWYINTFTVQHSIEYPRIHL